MSALIGLMLAVVISTTARWVQFDRDRVFYPVVLIVIASYYVLFAALDGQVQTLLTESAAMLPFVLAGLWAFKTNLWLVVVALVAHAIFDGCREGLISNAGMPEWWPSFCLAYDLGAAAFLTGLIASGRLDARPASAHTK